MGLIPIIVKVKMRDITQNERNDSKYYLLCYPPQKSTWESMMLELLTFWEADKNLPNDMLMKHLLRRKEKYLHTKTINPNNKLF